MRILLAEDDSALAHELAGLLRRSRFAVDVALDGVEACHLGETENYDAAILDIGLPLLDGLAVLERWRTGGRTIPVLVLTAMDSWDDKARGFMAGADDYLTKPFLPAEVSVRLHALIRRSHGHASARVCCGHLVYDTFNGAFELHSAPLKLTAYEWRLLAALILRKEVTVSRLDLADKVYEHGADVDFSSLEVLIGRLRKKIGPEMIETTRGLGYRLTAGRT